MSEEIPPSALTARSTPASGNRFDGLLFQLRLSERHWLKRGTNVAGRSIYTVVGAWILFAWNRFGFQGAMAPRAVTRFLLVGVYSWLAIAAAIWLGVYLLDRFRPDWDESVNSKITSDASNHSSASTPVDPARVLQMTGLAHQPLVYFGVILQIGQAVNVPYVVATLAGLFMLVWFPAQLGFATAGALRRPVGTVAPVALAGYVVWLLLAGLYLFDKLGHLF